MVNADVVGSRPITRDATFPHPHPWLLAHVCGWKQIIIIDGQLCPWKDNSNPAPRKEKEKKDEARASHLVAYIHNPVTFFYCWR